MSSTPISWPHGVAGLAAILTRLRHALRERIRVRRAMTELSQLDDRTLADIGLQRADIASVATRTRAIDIAGQIDASTPVNHNVALVHGHARGSR